MRCIHVRHKCQGMSLLMPLSPSKNNSLLPQARRGEALPKRFAPAEGPVLPDLLYLAHESLSP
jgi:hypothetical protein